MKIKRLSTALFALAILVPALTHLHAFTTFARPAGVHWTDGSLTRAFDAHYEDESYLRPFGIGLFAAAQLVLFNEGRAGVHIGTDGWLYSSEEIRGRAREEHNVAANLAAIGRIAAALEARGIGLLLVPVPAKARIQQTPLKPGLAAYVIELGRLQRLEAFADERGIAHAGLAASFSRMAAEMDVFMRTDTHWRPQAARHAAAEVAEVVAAKWPSISAGPGTLEPLAPVRHTGDLMSFLPLGPAFAWLGPAPEEVTPYGLQQAATLSATDLFAEEKFDVVLVGTSYSANPLWCFAACLEAALGVPVLNLAEAGRGPLLPVLDLLQSDLLNVSPPRLVIWEFPERFLGFDYGLPVARQATDDPTPPPKDAAP